jgi:hypothetical protein
MPTSKPLFYEFLTRKKIRGTFTKFCEKKCFVRKNDEITRFDSNYLCALSLTRGFEGNVEAVIGDLLKLKVTNYNMLIFSS